MESISNLHEFIKDEDFTIKFISEAKEAIKKRFCEITEDDVKEIAELSLKKFISGIDIVLKHNKNEGEKLKKQIEATINLNYLRSTNYLIQLQGLSILSDSLQINELCKEFYLKNK